MSPLLGVLVGAAHLYEKEKVLEYMESRLRLEWLEDYDYKAMLRRPWSNL